jgi:hypothetical protein
MKLLSTLLLLLSFNLYALDINIISDFDDTIKQTNVSNKKRALYNALFTQNAFEGMSDLFDMMSSYTNKLYVLSNSPNMFRRNMFKLLRMHDIQADYVSTRRLVRNANGFNYKYNFIVQQIKNERSQYILIGDDVGEDPEVYTLVKKRFPESIAEIYIHKVKNRKLPEGVIPYVTSFEIALNEYADGRMNLNEVMIIGQELFPAYNLKKVIPYYAHCPKQTTLWGQFQLPELQDIINLHAQKVIAFCKR